MENFTSLLYKWQSWLTKVPWSYDSPTSDCKIIQLTVLTYSSYMVLWLTNQWLLNEVSAITRHAVVWLSRGVTWPSTVEFGVGITTATITCCPFTPYATSAINCDRKSIMINTLMIEYIVTQTV